MIKEACLRVETQDGTVYLVEGPDHATAYEFLHLNNYASRTSSYTNDSITEGFLTDKGEFLDRSDAMIEARAHGQVRATNKETKLYSYHLV